jgi:uncharacterized membrane protein (GlpM family)
MQLIFRFLVGGLLVALFAVLADVLKPKSFAGLFGAAPSVAIAALGLTVLSNGKPYAALEGRSMIAGAVAFFVYACVCAHMMAKRRFGAFSVTLGGLALWLGCALGAWLVVLR